jgi:hypothetical protein
VSDPKGTRSWRVLIQRLLSQHNRNQERNVVRQQRALIHRFCYPIAAVARIAQLSGCESLTWDVAGMKAGEAKTKLGAFDERRNKVR